MQLDQASPPLAALESHQLVLLAGGGGVPSQLEKAGEGCRSQTPQRVALVIPTCSAGPRATDKWTHAVSRASFSPLQENGHSLQFHACLEHTF